jgi:DNA mismatch repair ATPase MutS
MRSEGFQRLLDMVHAELDDEYFGVIDGHLRALRFSGGVLTSARLGAGNKGTGYVLRRASNPNPGWRDRLSTLVHPEGLAFTIPDRDEAGARALSDLRDRGVDLVANALAQATEHVRSFFMMLRVELAFYVGCLNLHDTLAQLDQPVCEPEPLDGGATFAAEGLYDASLALKLGGGVVANDVDGADKDLIMITGANQGGKSTFLRSVGVAQLMLQAGMFAPATALRASVASGVFTHFKREEDATMRSGKLDEELRRMSAIADRLAPRGLVLFNESFAATNEREGSEIARQVIRALLDAGVRVVFVTHMFDLADTAYQRHSDRILFLRAERGEDGRRPFQLVPARPLPTSYGEDVYREIFGEDEPDAGAPPQAA